MGLPHIRQGAVHPASGGGNHILVLHKILHAGIKRGQSDYPHANSDQEIVNSSTLIYLSDR